MNEENKNIEYWKNNAEEDYATTPISVLRYITELEKELKEVKYNSVLGDFNHVPDWMPPLAVDHAVQLMKSGKRFAALKHILIFAKNNVDEPIKWCADFIEARSRLQQG